ncbi:carbohydrate-binding module family 20 domain-containing protein [Actinomadura viridis]|uniref:carbohydrate-binding module family 20 domain-containing protein n=1 Tax=Actinomadura viridis TaxID=58110 RepID=UPI0036C98E16
MFPGEPPKASDSIVGMVGWRTAVGDAAVANWQSPASNVIGFSRGDTGFVAINNSGGAHTSQFTTGLADGSYCNVTDDCASRVTVSGGKATLNIPGKSAVAFHTGGGSQEPGPVQTTFRLTAELEAGQTVHLVGDTPELGDGDDAEAVQLTSAGNGTYTANVSLPHSTKVTYNYFKKSGDTVHSHPRPSGDERVRERSLRRIMLTAWTVLFSVAAVITAVTPLTSAPASATAARAGDDQ